MNSINSAFIEFGTDHFFIQCLIDVKRFRKEKELSLLTRDKKAVYFMIDLSYKDGSHDIHIADNEKWIFNDFIRKLKDKEYDYLLTDLTTRESEIVKSVLKKERKELIKLLTKLDRKYCIACLGD